PLQRQAELLLKHKMMVEPCLVVCGQGHDQGAFGAQFDVDARGLHQVGGKRRPARLAVATKRNEGLLAGLGLAAGGQHSGCGVGGAAAGCAAVEDLDGRTAGGEPPGNAEANDTCANDGDLRFAGGRDAVRQAAAPFAGMTQTEVLQSSDSKHLPCQTCLFILYVNIGLLGAVSKREWSKPWATVRGTND